MHTEERRLPLAQWVALCAMAEAIGMTASAAAAQLASGLVGLGALAVIVAGGLVEGTALGVLQARGLSRWLPELKRGLWIAITIVVAGLGWAAASAPSALQGSSDQGGSPSLWLILPGGAALGTVMGAVLGLAQSAALRGNVTHPLRWVWVSAAAWTPAMAIIFLGATTPDETWTVLPVIVLGAVTGAVAGASLGLISGLLMPLLDRRTLERPRGAPARSRL